MGLLSTIGAASGRAFGLTRVGAAIRDAYFNLTTLLLPGNGTNGAQNNTFLDSSSNNFTITRNGNTTQGTFSPFSQTGWSNYFDGTDDYLSVADNAVLRPGAGVFTLEAWIYRGASGAAHTIYAKGGASTGIVFQVASTNVLRFTHTTTNIDSTGTIASDSWVHVAVVREGTGTNQTKLYINGTQDGQGTVSTDFTQTEEVRIGTDRSAAADFNGYISNLRFTKGAALYTGNFTPATSPLTTTSQGASSADVELLTCQSNRFIDNSSNGFAITVNGTPSIQAFSPFAPTAAYDAATVGGSGYFDGTGDYLASSSTTAFNSFCTGSATGVTFTVEALVYPTATVAGANAWQSAPIFAKGATYFCFGIYNDKLRFYWYDGAAKFVDSTATVPLNSWSQVSVTVNGSSITLYVNGSSSGTGTFTGIQTAAQGGAENFGYQPSSPNTSNFYGYISSVRISNNVRSISAQTAPFTSDANTIYLLNFTNAGITDATAKNDLETVGNAQISTTQSKFGGSSMYFDGTGDYLKGAYSPNMILSGDFTIECWLNFSAHGNYAGIVSFANSNTSNPPTSGWAFNFYSTTDRLYFETGTGFSLQATNAVTANQWNHVAIVRSGSTITHYLNGTANGSGTSSATFTPLTTDNFVIGVERGLSGTITGYIDDLRISRYARYTANFTPPTTAFPLQ